MTEREHITEGLDCWCEPRYYLPCDECQTGCWKCQRGRITLTRAAAEQESRPLQIVHNKPDRPDDPPPPPKGQRIFA